MACLGNVLEAATEGFKNVCQSLHWPQLSMHFQIRKIVNKLSFLIQNHWSQPITLWFSKKESWLWLFQSVQGIMCNCIVMVSGCTHCSSHHVWVKLFPRELKYSVFVWTKNIDAEWVLLSVIVSLMAIRYEDRYITFIKCHDFVYRKNIHQHNL